MMAKEIFSSVFGLRSGNPCSRDLCFSFLCMVIHGPPFASLKYVNNPEVNSSDNVATLGDLCIFQFLL
jgi:hypothetical protein